MLIPRARSLLINGKLSYGEALITDEIHERLVAVEKEKEEKKKNLQQKEQRVAKKKKTGSAC